MRHLEHVEISTSRWERWREAAHALGDEGIRLERELRDAVRDPSRHNLDRCAKAARHIEHVSTGEFRLIANAVATELEHAAA